MATELNFGPPVTACPPNWGLWSAADTALGDAQHEPVASLKFLPAALEHKSCEAYWSWVNHSFLAWYDHQLQRATWIYTSVSPITERVVNNARPLTFHVAIMYCTNLKVIVVQMKPWRNHNYKLKQGFSVWGLRVRVFCFVIVLEKRHCGTE